MTRRKKVLLAVIGVVALMVSYLCAHSLIATSHPIARAAMAQSPAVAQSVGGVAGALLVGTRQKLAPLGLSCARNTYLVLGNAGIAVVVAELSMDGTQPAWRLDRLSMGWFIPRTGNC